MIDTGTNILLTRRVRPEMQASFVEAVRAFVPLSLEFPGHLGVLIVAPSMTHPEPGVPVEHGVVLRFRDAAAWQAFREWAPYIEFQERLRPMLVEPPAARTIHGMEAWFAPDPHRPPARWKLFILTALGVNLFAVPVTLWLKPHLTHWPFWASFVLGNTTVVLGVVWLFMPAMSRLLHAWLHSVPKGVRP